MFQINGSIAVLPEKVSVEPGEVEVTGNKVKVVFVKIITSSGQIDLILPAENVDGIAEGLKKARVQSSGLEVAQSLETVEGYAKELDEARGK